MNSEVFYSAHSAKHHSCGENTIFIPDAAVAAVLFRNSSDGLDSHTISLALGGTEHTVLLLDLSAEWIFNQNQQQVTCVHIGLHRWQALH